MKITELKSRIDYYQNGKVYNDNPDFVSILVIERYYKKKFQEYLDKTADFTRYLEKIVNIDIKQVIPNRSYDDSFRLEIEGTEKGSWINPRKKANARTHRIQIDFKSLTMRLEIEDCYNPPYDPEMFKEDSVVKEYIDYLTKFIATYDMCCLRRPSSAGLFVDMYFDTSRRVFAINISDSSNAAVSMPHPFGTRTDDSKDKDKSCNFYYFKNIFEGDVGLPIDYKTTRKSRYAQALALVYPHTAIPSTGFYPANEATERFLNRELLDAMYPCLKVDPSGLSKQVQEELRQIELANRTKLSEEMQSNLISLKEQQIAKLMRAYQLIKEAAEILDGIQSTINFEPIKLENIRSIIFKNGGTPTENGRIEFEDFFKNNTVLRMLDLSTLDLTDVDIRGMDFTGTNIHIDPQKIYNKDMTDVDATGLKFSPFTDSFEGVILKGTIITDKEANIDLDTVAEYDNRTVIKKDNIIIK